MLGWRCLQVRAKVLGWRCVQVRAKVLGWLCLQVRRHAALRIVGIQ